MGKIRNENPVAVGDRFTLYCGVVVEVIQYISYGRVTVSDGKNVKEVSANCLRKGEIAWIIDGIKHRARAPKPRKTHKKTLRKDGLTNGLPKKYSVGAILETKHFGKILVTCVTEENITVVFQNTGSSVTKPANANFSKSNLVDRAVVNPKNLNYMSRKFPVGTRILSQKHGWFTILRTCAEGADIVWEEGGHKQFVSKSKMLAGTARNDSISGNYLKPVGNFIYTASLDDKLLYLGMGVDGRYNHCNSGKSSCYLLNKRHFEGKFFEVGIAIDGLSGEQARTIEAFLILKFLPEGNTCVSRKNILDLENKVKSMPQSISEAVLQLDFST